MSAAAPHDELASTICDAVQQLTHNRHLKATFLLDTTLALIDAGQYGPDVEKYFEVYLRTPGLSTEDITRALLARGGARERGGKTLSAKAIDDFQAALKLNPSNVHLRRKLHQFSSEPASQRIPLKIWERIASHTPRYHLRTWLFVSSFHRDIAMRHIFHTIDIYFGDEQQGNLNRGLDIFDRAKADPGFACLVKSLRLHWAYEEGDMLDLMRRIFKTALPAFKALQDFEWIGYPELRSDMVQAVLASHKHLHGLGLIGWHFDAVGISAFINLRKFTLRAEDDDGFADMGEIRTVLDQNSHTLRHLILGAYLERRHSWDSAFQSATITNLTHLDLVDTRISHVVLSRIAHAHNLESLTLHGIFEEPGSAAVVFGSDHIVDGRHTFLPHLVSFRFLLVGHDDDHALYHSVTQFLRQRKELRRLDLGSCPWEMVLVLLPDLRNLRVLGVKIANLTQGAVASLVDALPVEMQAVNLSTVVSQHPINEYALSFVSFPALFFLHLRCANKRRPKQGLVSGPDFQSQTDMWIANARSVATAIPSLDFLGWHGEHYVVLRSDYNHGDTSGGSMLYDGGSVELKQLPTRRRLDCANGVDLGGEDAAWLERKDVPVDFEMSGLDQEVFGTSTFDTRYNDPGGVFSFGDPVSALLPVGKQVVA